MKNALGRLPRHFQPAIPHMSALRMLRRDLPPVPAQIDYAKDLPANLGVMLNDRLGDCTAAACYHAQQIWTKCVGGDIRTAPDDDVVRWYSECSGYDPHTGANDNGAVEQSVLIRWLTLGIPWLGGRDRLLGFVEIDPRNLADVRRAVYECGTAYIGFNVPSDIPEAAGATWDVCHGSTEGGHCVVLFGFDAGAFGLISWGARYHMTETFWHTYVDEAYALIDPEWANANGTTLLGMSLDQLRAQMEYLKQAA